MHIQWISHDICTITFSRGLYQQHTSVIQLHAFSNQFFLVQNDSLTQRIPPVISSQRCATEALSVHFQHWVASRLFRPLDQPDVGSAICGLVGISFHKFAIWQDIWHAGSTTWPHLGCHPALHHKLITSTSGCRESWELWVPGVGYTLGSEQLTGLVNYLIELLTTYFA